jgi:acyl-CoA synthetase (AMP-forming)/AMP-acid ligase II
MLSQLILEETVPLRQQAVVTRTQSTTWGELREETLRIGNSHQALGKRRVGLSFPPVAASYASLAALDKLACDVFLLDARLPLEEAMRLARKLRLGALIVPPADGGSTDLDVRELPDSEAWSGNHTVTILTSGSTGEPKAARHTFESLSRPVRKGPENLAPRWLLTYRPNLYAGLQVMLQCFVDRGTLAAADLEMDPQATAQFMSDTGVQFVSATPSYWRRLLMFADTELLRKIPLVQITLGGEVIDQPILDNLRRHFPSARLVHIYATTELGRCFSVSDGIAGFPATYLDTVLPDGTELRLQEGELLIRSLNSMKMYDPLSVEHASASNWFSTGDLVEISNGRAYFVGRRTEMINVAGSKVYPVEVERVLRGIAGVADVRVFGKTSSIAGELVACEIVPGSDQARESLKEEVIRICRLKLASHQQPRLIKFVERIEVSAAGKTLRGRTS